MTPTTVYLDLERLLTQHLTRVNALTILSRAIRKHGLQPHNLRREHLSRLAPDLRSGLLLFANQAQRNSMAADLKNLLGNGDALPAPKLILVTKEADIAAARAAAKSMCEFMGASTLIAHRVATVASELTRNIVLYAGKGEVSFVGGRGGGMSLKITALDRGPGIQSLSHILSGNYRSKTGMGKGLLGVRRLCDEFDVDTSPQGTRVQVQVRW